MYTSFPMYSCWGNILIDGEFQWVKGFDCGVDMNTRLVCFMPEDDSRTKYYLLNEDLCYEYEKPE